MLLRKGGSLAGLFLIGEPEPGGRLYLVEGRAEKALAIAAAGCMPVAGFGGRQVLGRQALPAGIATAIVVPGPAARDQHGRRTCCATSPGPKRTTPTTPAASLGWRSPA